MDMTETIVGIGVAGIGAAVYATEFVAEAIAPFISIPLVLAGVFTLLHGLVEGEQE